MNKLVATTLAAGALIVGVAGPASATVTDHGKSYSVSGCSVAGSPCNFTLKVDASHFTVAVVDTGSAGGYIWDCSAKGVPDGSAVTKSRLQTLVNAGAWVTVVWDRPVGYRDAVTCD